MNGTQSAIRVTDARVMESRRTQCKAEQEQMEETNNSLTTFAISRLRFLVQKWENCKNEWKSDIRNWIE